MRPSGMVPSGSSHASHAPSRPPRPARSVLSRLVVVLVLLLGPVAGTAGRAWAAGSANPDGAASATMAAGAVRVTFTTGFGGRGIPGTEVPVRVRIAADRLVAGSVEVSVRQEGGPVAARVSAPVEVPGGSVKEYLLVVPTPSVTPLRVEARVSDRRGEVASQRATLQVPEDEELVGLLPGVLAGTPLPGPAPLAVDAGVARFFLLDELLVARAPQSIESLGTIGMPADGLRTLAPAARAALLQWVSAGGRLLVDLPPQGGGPEASGASPVWGLPDQWQPGAGARRAAGRGEVATTGGAMAAGRWESLIEPTARGTFAETFLSPADLIGSALAQDAGLVSRGQGWLTGMLLAYVVVVGPLLYLVLRRRRREALTWVAVPVVAVLFATGSYVQGRQLRAAGDAHASVVVSAPQPEGGGAGSVPAGESAPVAPTAVSYVGIVADRAGTTRLQLPRGWSVRLSGNGSGSLDGAPVRIATTRSGQEVGLPLNSGQAGVVAGSGPVADLAPGSGLVVTAAVKDGQLTGVVRNATPWRLETVAAVVGTGATAVGTLDPGQERAWTMGGDAALPAGDPLVSVVASMVPEEPGPSGVFDQAVGAYGLWQGVQTIVGRDLPAPGVAMAVGWTRDWRPSFVVNGRTEQPPGRSMVLGTSAVSYLSGRVPALGVAREQVRGVDTLEAFGGFGGGGPSGSSVVRFLLPPGAAPRPLVVRTLTGAQVDLWRDGAWHAFDPAAGTPVDDASLPAGPDGTSFVPQPVPFPPKAVLVRPGVDRPGGAPASTLVEHDLGTAGGSAVFVRVRTADGQVPAGVYTWVRER